MAVGDQELLILNASKFRNSFISRSFAAERDLLGQPNVGAIGGWRVDAVRRQKQNARVGAEAVDGAGIQKAVGTRHADADGGTPGGTAGGQRGDAGELPVLDLAKALSECVSVGDQTNEYTNRLR